MNPGSHWPAQARIQKTMSKDSWDPWADLNIGWLLDLATAVVHAENQGALPSRIQGYGSGIQWGLGGPGLEAI